MIEIVRQALSGKPAWIVGGTIRDRLLGIDGPVDVDVVVDGDPRAAAKAIAKAEGGPAFELSDDFGAWRVMAKDRSWQVDVSALRGGSIEVDLALRDFTINAIAEPLDHEGARHLNIAVPDTFTFVDPFGGVSDVEARRLRMVRPEAFADDPLRVVRLARFAITLGLEVERDTAEAARAQAHSLDRVAGERVFAELRQILSARNPHLGIDLLRRVGAAAVILPELEELRDVEQTVYHHRDVYGHTLEVLQRAAELDDDPGAILGEEHAARIRAFLDEPLGDGLTRAGGLRLGALLHDVAKPPTQTPSPKGGFGFPGHDRLGAGMARDIMARLKASEKLRAHVAALTRHHLRLGFLTHQAPVDRRALYGYVTATQPVEVDVSLLSVADRLATRGRKANEAIERHVALARELIGPLLDWHEQGPPAPLLRGDELARELGIDPGPELGRLLAELAEAQYVGVVASRDDAVRFARAAAPHPR